MQSQVLISNWFSLKEDKKVVKAVHISNLCYGLFSPYQTTLMGSASDFLQLVCTGQHSDRNVVGMSCDKFVCSSLKMDDAPVNVSQITVMPLH